MKVLDFGIAKILDSGRLNGQVTSTGDLVGTPYYMAPERLLGRECDASADVYSVGLILYRALAGRLPFEGTVAEIMVQAVSKRPRDIRATRPGATPRDRRDDHARARRATPGDRPTASELARALGRAAVAAPRGVHAA